jgi:collagenase-like PrtC family protease
VLQRSFDNYGDWERNRDNASCAVCAAYLFRQYGVHGLKIIGRNYPVEAVLRSVRRLRAYLDKISAGAATEENFVEIGRSVTGCTRESCYHYEIYQKAKQSAARGTGT